MRLLLLFFILIPFIAYSQREVRTFYDPARQQLQEVYIVANDDDEKLIGTYQKYFPNGTLAVEGNFSNGKKSGVFTEYHDTGKLSRKMV